MELRNQGGDVIPIRPISLTFQIKDFSQGDQLGALRLARMWDREGGRRLKREGIWGYMYAYS